MRQLTVMAQLLCCNNPPDLKMGVGVLNQSTVDLLQKPLAHHPQPLPACRATVYTQVELPPLIPPFQGGKPENLVPSPMHRGGLGWGKTRIYRLFPTSVYTGGLRGGERLRQQMRGGVLYFCHRATICHPRQIICHRIEKEKTAKHYNVSRLSVWCEEFNYIS